MPSPEDLPDPGLRPVFLGAPALVAEFFIPSTNWEGPWRDQGTAKKVKVFVAQSVSDSVTPWAAARQASQSMEFSRQEYWDGLPCPLTEDLPNPGIKAGSSALQVDSVPSEPPGMYIFFMKLS